MAGCSDKTCQLDSIGTRCNWAVLLLKAFTALLAGTDFITGFSLTLGCHQVVHQPILATTYGSTWQIWQTHLSCTDFRGCQANTQPRQRSWASFRLSRFCIFFVFFCYRIRRIAKLFNDFANKTTVSNKRVCGLSCKSYMRRIPTCSRVLCACPRAFWNFHHDRHPKSNLHHLTMIGKGTKQGESNVFLSNPKHGPALPKNCKFLQNPAKSRKNKHRNHEPIPLNNQHSIGCLIKKWNRNETNLSEIPHGWSLESVLLRQDHGDQRSLDETPPRDGFPMTSDVWQRNAQLL